MNLIINIISERCCPTLTLNLKSDESKLFALQLISIFCEEMNLDEGITVCGRTYQRKTKKLLSELQSFIQNSENQQQLWSIYNVFSEMEEGEYFAFLTQNIDNYNREIIKDNILHLNHPDYEYLLKFKNEFCSGIVANYNIIHYENGKKQLKIGESDKSKRKCRFCGESMPIVTFAKVAHTISEGLGNKTIITNDECDSCNETLGREIEQDLMTYLSPLRIFMSITGRHGKTKIKDDSFSMYESAQKSIHIDLIEQENAELMHWTLKQDNDNFKVSFTHPQMVNLQDVYRTVVKYAIGVMDNEQLKHFIKTINWIKKEMSSSDLPRLCLFLDGSQDSELKPSITVFIRKNADKALPYSFVELHVSGVVIFAIIPFCDQDNRSFSDVEDWNHTMDVLKIYKKLPLLKCIVPNNDESERITFNIVFNKRTDIDA